MMDKTTITSGSAEISSADLDMLLGDLSVDDIEESTEAVEDVVQDEGIVVVNDLPLEASGEPEPSQDDLEAAVSELDLEEAKAAVYDSTEGSDVTTEAAASEEKPAKAKKERKAPAPKVRIAVTDLEPGAFVLTTDVPADLEANKAAVLARRPAQKKVAEKFDNLLISVAAGKLPSIYTVDCYKVLKAKGEVTSAELVAALTSTAKKIDTSACYTIGTARSQAGQIMSLFPSLKIATREGNKLVLNPNSTLAMALDALLAA